MDYTVKPKFSQSLHSKDTRDVDFNVTDHSGMVLTLDTHYTFGEFDATNIPSIMSDVRKPVFVDNAVHYGELTSQVGAKSKVTLTQESKEEYKLATEKSYSYSESESSILLTHKETPGHSIKSTIWSPEGETASPNCAILRRDGERLRKHIREHYLRSESRTQEQKNRNLHSLGITRLRAFSATFGCGIQKH